MHETGTKVLAALNEFFPEADIRAFESRSHSMLGVSFKAGDNRLAAYTPVNLDYRELPYQEWLHRFSEIIREEVTCPKSSTPPSPCPAGTLSVAG